MGASREIEATAEGRTHVLRILVALVEGSERDAVLRALGAREGTVIEQAPEVEHAETLVGSERYDLVTIIERDAAEAARSIVRVLRQQEVVEERGPTPVVGISGGVGGETLVGVLAGVLDRWAPRLIEAREAPPVHPSMLDLIPGFLSRRHEDVAALREAFGRDDLEGLGRVAHKMRGSGTTYGFPWLSVVGEALETAATDGDLAAIRDGLEQLDDVLAAYPGL